MQPDTRAVEEYLMNKFGMEKDAVVLVPVNGKASVWRPWNEVEGRNGNLAKWMKGEGYQLYIAMGLTSETWRRAIAEVCEHHVYLTNHSSFVEQMKEIALTKEEQKAIEEHGDEAVGISVAFGGISSGTPIDHRALEALPHSLPPPCIVRSARTGLLERSLDLSLS